jgi:hypothetical protein
MKAQAALEEGSYDPADDQSVYRLVLAATGSIQAAKRAETESLKVRVKQSETK